MNKRKKFLWILMIPVIPVILCGCAKRGMPPGGPEDKTPPKLVESIPESGTTNVPVDNYSLKLIFDEPIEENPGFISILPDIPVKVKFKGKTIEMFFTNRLTENTTYTVTLSPRLKDTKGNQIGNAKTIAFSTGTELDTGKIVGIVVDYNFEPVEGALVVAYEDSIRGSPPLRSTISGNGGGFSLEFLPQQPIWIFALTGVSKPDFTKAELYAVPSGKIVPSSNDTIVCVLVPADTVPPKLARCDALDSLTARLVFQRPVDISTVDMELPAKIWTDYTDSNSLFARWSIKPDAVKIKKVCDNFSLCSENLVINCELQGTDTIPPILNYPKGRTKSQKGKQIKLTFSEPVTISLTIDSSETSLKSDCVLGENIVFLPQLTESRTISLKICDENQNCVQESLEISMVEETPNAGNLTISCYNEFCQSAHEVKFFVKAGKRIILPAFHNNQPVPLDGGRYSIWSFRDDDGNSRWTPGRLYPFKPSEELKFLRDTVEVRARWETEIRW